MDLSNCYQIKTSKYFEIKQINVFLTSFLQSHYFFYFLNNLTSRTVKKIDAINIPEAQIDYMERQELLLPPVRAVCSVASIANLLLRKKQH